MDLCCINPFVPLALEGAETVLKATDKHLSNRGVEPCEEWAWVEW